MWVVVCSNPISQKLTVCSTNLFRRYLMCNGAFSKAGGLYLILWDQLDQRTLAQSNGIQLTFAFLTSCATVVPFTCSMWQSAVSRDQPPLRALDDLHALRTLSKCGYCDVIVGDKVPTYHLFDLTRHDTWERMWPCMSCQAWRPKLNRAWHINVDCSWSLQSQDKDVIQLKWLNEKGELFWKRPTD